MNDQAPPSRRSETSGRRPLERSPRARCAATFAELDATLEVRGRLVAIADELDTGDAGTALLNVRLLLTDLDEVAA